MVKSSLACGLQTCIGQLWDNNHFSDFTVIVGDKRYQCHQLILRACSRFFDALLRSEMRESIEGCTELLDMTSDTFDVIINSVYKGIDGLTEENVVSVWKAVHLLQIDYLITECEDFMMRTMSLENYLEYYACAKLLQSHKILKLIYDLMISNFDQFRETETFLELTADELYMIVESHNLNIKSEELVVKSILGWAFHEPTFCSKSEIIISHNSKKEQGFSAGREDHNKEKVLTDDTAVNKSEIMATNYTEVTVSTDNQQNIKVGSKTEVSTNKEQVKNVGAKEVEETGVSVKGGNNCKDKDRVMELRRLLKVARLCFLRLDYLQDLIKHPVISTNKEALAELLNAYFYQQKVHHDYWPSTALHRSCSDMTHAMVYVDGQNEYCKVYSLDTGSTHVLCELPTWYDYDYTNLSLGISDQMLFLGVILGQSHIVSHICFWEQSLGWTKCTLEMDGAIDILLPHGQQFYIISSDAEKNDQFRLGKILFDTLRTENVVRAAVSCGRYILMLEKAIDCPSETEKTAVMCYDTVTKKTTRLQDWDGPPYSTISFTCGDNVYILQGNGTLRLVISIDDDDNNDKSKKDNDKVLFQLVAKLWDFDWKPYGAVVYQDELIIFGNLKNSEMCVTSVPGNSDFKTIKTIKIDSRSECRAMIVPKAWLKKTI